MPAGLSMFVILHNVGNTSHAAQIRSLFVPDFIFPGHDAMNGSLIPPSYKNPLLHPNSFLKGRLLLKNSQSAPPSLDDPLSLETIMIVFSYTPACFNLATIWPTCSSKSETIAARVARG